MKLFLVLLFVGCVSASFQDAFEKASNAAIQSFKQGVEQAPSLHLALGIENNDVVQRFERSLKDDLEKYLKDAFERTLKKIEDAEKEGKEVNKEALKSLRELKEKMDQLQIEDHELDGLKEKLDDHLRRLLKEMNIITKRSIQDDPMNSVFEDLSFRNFFLRVKQMILEKMDVTNLKHGLSKAVGQVSQNLCEWVTNKGKEKVINFFDRILDAEENPAKRSVQEYFEDLEIEFKRKIQLFREWMKNIIEKGFHQSKNDIESVRSMAEKLSVEEYLKSLKIEFQKKLELFREWMKNIVNKINDKSQNKIEKRSIKEYLELLEIGFKERMEFFENWVRHMIDQIKNQSKSQTEKRSVKEYLELLDIEFQKKLEFYRNLLKNMLEKGIDMSKSKVENIRTLAREILNKTKHMSKEVAQEALEFVRQYKEELGYMYDILQRRIMDKISEYTD